ncbi:MULTISPECIES: hypothetical protein [unclassified Bradyrhizobium]|uniref:hypothetical protein n=1 Tax=unclassified Bradyrhizobium TaxID=2631580 RepID=UPI0012F7BBE9|nr:MULTISPECIES: hypothetical protein [unclassified Bradyrhizobium]MCK1430553.1 hypothetical protein [Bradyrhizobium sp. 87]
MNASGTPPPAAARRDLHLDEQAIDGRGVDGQNTITVRLAKLQSAILLAGSKVGIIALSRLPHAQSHASHSAVIASLIVAPYLRLRSRRAAAAQAQPLRVAGVRAPRCCSDRREVVQSSREENTIGGNAPFPGFIEPPVSTRGSVPVSLPQRPPARVCC